MIAGPMRSAGQEEPTRHEEAALDRSPGSCPGEDGTDWSALAADLYRLVEVLPAGLLRSQDRLDLVHDVFVRLRQRFGGNPPRVHAGYLRQCLRNGALNLLSLRKRGACGSLPDEVEDEQRATGSAPSRTAGARVVTETIPAELRVASPSRPNPMLTDLQARVVELRLAGESIHRIASILERSRSQVQAILKAVRAKVGAEMSIPERLSGAHPEGLAGAEGSDGGPGLKSGAASPCAVRADLL